MDLVGLLVKSFHRIAEGRALAKCASRDDPAQLVIPVGLASWRLVAAFTGEIRVRAFADPPWPSPSPARNPNQSRRPMFSPITVS